MNLRVSRSSVTAALGIVFQATLPTWICIAMLLVFRYVRDSTATKRGVVTATVSDSSSGAKSTNVGATTGTGVTATGVTMTDVGATTTGSDPEEV